jgi:hypothetical protein
MRPHRLRSRDITTSVAHVCQTDASEACQCVHQFPRVLPRDIFSLGLVAPCFSYIHDSSPQVAPTGSQCLEETLETVPELARPNSVASGETFPIFCIWGLEGTISSVTGRNYGTIGHLLLCHRAEDGLATCIWSLLLRNRYTTGLIHFAGYPINRCYFCLSRRRELRYFFLSRVLRVIHHDVHGDQTVREEPSLT